MTLQYLDFDYSEDALGYGAFEAMATVPSARLSALQTEIVRVLAWAHEAFPGEQGPLEEGGVWDYLLEGQREWSEPQAMAYDRLTQRISSQPGPVGEPRHTVTLSLSGNAQFCDAFRDAFGL